MHVNLNLSPADKKLESINENKKSFENLPRHIVHIEAFLLYIPNMLICHIDVKLTYIEVNIYISKCQSFPNHKKILGD